MSPIARPFLVIAILVLLLAISPGEKVTACGGYEDYPAESFTVFLPAANDNASMAPYFFTPALLYQDPNGKFKSPNIPDDRELNVMEWSSFLGAGVDTGSIGKMIYSTPLATLQKAEKEIREAQGKKYKNKAIKALSEGDKSEVLRYLIFAKQCERYVSGSGHIIARQWDYKNLEYIKPDNSSDSLAMLELIKEGTKMYTNAFEPWLKTRIAFQNIRLANYSNADETCVRLYDGMMAPLPTSSFLKPWAMLLKAISHDALGQESNALYWFSRAFVLSPNKQHRAILTSSYNPSEMLQKSAQTLCFNNTEKADLLAFAGIKTIDQNGGLAIMRDLYALAPNSLGLEVILNREVNKVEIASNISTAPYFLNSLVIDGDDNPYLDLLKFLQSVDKSKVAHPALWDLAIAEMLYLNSDYANALETLEILKYERNLTLPQGLVARELKLLSMIPLTSIIAQDRSSGFNYTLDSLVPHLLWLEKESGSNSYFGEGVLSMTLGKLQTYLKGQQESDNHGYSMSMLINPGYTWNNPSPLELIRQSRYSGDLEDLLAYWKDKKETPWNIYLANRHTLTEVDVFDAQGSLLLGEHKYDEAYQVLSKVPPTYYDAQPFSVYLDSDPFTTSLAESHATIPGNKVTRYNEIDFAKKMAKSMADTKSDNEKVVAQAWHDLGLGAYHTSFYGNSWMMTKYGWSSGDPYAYTNPGGEDDGYSNYIRSGDDNITQAQRDYYLCETAKDYAEEAIRSALVIGNEEMATEAHFYYARAWQKFTGNYPEVNSNDYETIITTGMESNRNFELLKLRYNKTKFYQSAIVR